MGYESKLYVVHKSSNIKEKDMYWCEVIASFDLCKVDIDFRKYPDTDAYFYEGDEKIIEDCYGDHLKELTLQEAITEIENAMTRGHYRRWNPILGLLKGFNEDEWGPVNALRVLHYGH